MADGLTILKAYTRQALACHAVSMDRVTQWSSFSSVAICGEKSVKPVQQSFTTKTAEHLCAGCVRAVKAVLPSGER